MIGIDEWTKQKEQRVLRGYRYTLTYRIITVGLLLLSVYAVYIIALTVTYDKTTNNEKLTTYAQLYVDWTHPGISSSHSFFSRSHISPLLTQSTSIPIIRQVGKAEIEVGEFQIDKPILTSIVRRQYDFYQPNDQPKFSFYLPIHPESGKVLSAPNSSTAWEILDKVHEGTVADLAFSTKDYYTPDELFKLLEEYDVDINWMALYMGEIKNFGASWSGSSDSLSIYPWGLTHGRAIGEDYWINTIYYLAPENVEKVQAIMLDNMQRIYRDDPKLAEKLFHSGNLPQRIEFLKEHGFMVYGAVITGPTKELLRLQEVNEIQGAQIGKISYWNWIN